LAAEWPGTLGAIFVVPLWHPVALAEHVATLAALSQGRFVLQAALGWRENEFAAMGVGLHDRVRRFEAGLAVVRRLLNGEAVSEPSIFEIDGAEIGPAVQNVDVWVAGHAPQALQRAAHMADGWIGGPAIPVEEAARLAEAYRRACGESGARPGTVALRRDIHVAADATEAADVMTDVIREGYRGFDPSVLIVGDREAVASELRSLGDAGFDEVVVRQLAGSERDALRSIERLHDVRTALNAAHPSAE
ncbi:MAG: LLM class flavin-dependent oxidoreductase, partial [Actinomycetota bacterium]